MNRLDELVVPQPPYRMKRPEAVLAVAQEPIAGQPEAGVPVAPSEKVSPLEAQASSPAEKIAARWAAMKAADQAARAEIEQNPPLVGATAQEAQQAVENQQSVLAKIETASAEVAPKVQEVVSRAYNTLEDLEKEQKRLFQIAQEANVAGNDARANIAMEGALMLRGPLEQKRKEDAAREDKKLSAPGGIEFEQPQELATEKADRLGREALDKLNEFKNAHARNAKPEEVEFARQQADLSQKQAEAAQRGETIPEDRVDMAKVEAAGTPEGRDAILGARLSELMRAAQDASASGDKAAASDAGREFIKVRSERIRLRNQHEAEGQKATDGDTASAAPTPEVDDKAPTADVGSQRVNTPETPDIKAAREAAGVVATPDVTPGLEEAFDAEGNLKLVPLPERVPTPEQKRITELEEENARLKAERARPQSNPEDLKLPTVERAEAGQQQKPGETLEAVREILDLERIGKEPMDMPFLERQGLKMEALGHNVAAWWWEVMAKRAKDTLAKKDVTIKAMEKKSEALRGSWWGVAVNPVVYGGRLAWHRLQQGGLDNEQRRYNTRRKIHEDLRNEMLNQIAQSVETAMNYHETQMNEAGKELVKIDANLEKINSEMKRMNLALAESENADRKRRILGELALLKARYQGYVKEMGPFQARHQEHEAKFIELRHTNDRLLSRSAPGTNTEPEKRKHLGTRQRRGKETLTEAA